MRILKWVILPEKEYQNTLDKHENTIYELAAENKELSRDRDRWRSEAQGNPDSMFNATRLNDIIRHIQYTLKNKPALTQFNWSLEYQPYIERLEKITRGEMNR